MSSSSSSLSSSSSGGGGGGMNQDGANGTRHLSGVYRQPLQPSGGRRPPSRGHIRRGNSSRSSGHFRLENEPDGHGSATAGKHSSSSSSASPAARIGVPPGVRDDVDLINDWFETRPTSHNPSFWAQMRALTWKNLLLKRRNFRTTLGEILFPVYIVFILYLSRFITISSSNQGDGEEGISGIDFEPYSFLNASTAIPIGSLAALGVANLTAVAPAGNLTDYILSFAPDGAHFQVFESKEALVEAQAADGDAIRFGIVFNDSDVDPTEWEWETFQYTLLTPDFGTGVATLPTTGDGGSAFNVSFEQVKVAVQASIEMGLVGAATGTNVSLGLRLADMPEVEGFSVAALVLAFIYPYMLIQAGFLSFQAMTAQLGMEKEKKIKETLRLTGMRDSSFWVSWMVSQSTTSVTSMILLAILCHLLSLITAVSIVWTALTFALFATAQTSFTFLFSVFFNKAKTLFYVGIFGLILNAGLFYGIEFLVFANDLGIVVNAICCLLPSVPFGHFVFTVVLWAGVSNDDGVFMNLADGTPSLGLCLLMLAVDTIWLALLAWYLDNIYPFKEFGITQRCCFACSRGYWRPDRAAHHVHPDGVRVETAALWKIYKPACASCRKGSEETAAVRGLDLAIPENEIFGLVGTNGAGKTSLISTLTGVLHPSGGEAFIDGYSLTTQVGAVRELISLVPQFDVVYDELTPIEHLDLHSGLKGLADFHASNILLLKALGLGDKVDAAVGTLSGGQKRRVSLALGLIGQPRVIFLDEPTTGVDVFVKREIWHILQRMKAHSTIVLTSHSMEEVDLLASTVAIMVNGNIRVQGTSIELKNALGGAYKVHFNVAPEVFDEDRVRRILQEHVDRFFAARADEASGSDTDTRVRVVSWSGTQVSFSLPVAAVPVFGDALAELDDLQADLGIDSYSISLTTLEEVFLRIAREAEEGSGSTDGSGYDDGGGEQSGDGGLELRPRGGSTSSGTSN